MKAIRMNIELIMKELLMNESNLCYLYQNLNHNQMESLYMDIVHGQMRVLNY